MPIITYDLEANTEDFELQIGGAVNALGSVAAAMIAATAAGKTLIDNVFGRVDQINTWAAATGLSTQAVNALANAAEAANKDLGQLIPQGFAKRMLDVKNGTGEALLAVKGLGIEVTDSNKKLRDADVLFRELLGSVLDTEDAILKAALAEQIFGENGREMLSAFDNIEGFDHFVETSNKWGVDVGPEAVRMSNEWWAATKVLNTAFDEVANNIATVVAPMATAFVEGLATGIIFVASLITEVFQDTARQVSNAAMQFELWRAGVVDLGDALSAVFMTEEEALENRVAIIDRAMVHTKSFWDDLIGGATAGTQSFKDFEDQVDDTTSKVGGWFLEISKLAEKMALDSERAAVRALDALEKQAGQSVTEIERAAEQATALGDRLLSEAEAREEAQTQIVSQAASDSLMAWNDYFDGLMQMQHEKLIDDQQNLIDREKLILEELKAEEDADEGAIKSQEEKVQKVTDSANKEVQASFEQSQAWARGQVAINAATAAIGMVAQMAPFIGPAAPLAAAAVLGPAVALQLAEINAQKAPAVRHGGGVSGLAPDEVQFAGLRALAGEGLAVINKQAMDAGAANQVNAINGRQDGAAGGGQRPVQLVMTDAARRAIATVALEEMRTPGAAALQATSNGQPRGYVNPYSRS